jgi:hypothetical protein
MTRQIDQRADVRFYDFQPFSADFQAWGKRLDLRYYLGSEESENLNLSVTGTCVAPNADLVIFDPQDIATYWRVRRLANRGRMTLLLGGEPDLAYNPEIVKKMQFLAEDFEREGITDPSLESVGFCFQIPKYELPSAFIYEVEDANQRSLIHTKQENKDLIDLLVNENFLDALVLKDERAIRESVAMVNEQQAEERIIVSGGLSEVLNS